MKPIISQKQPLYKSDSASGTHKNSGSPYKSGPPLKCTLLKSSGREGLPQRSPRQWAQRGHSDLGVSPVGAETVSCFQTLFYLFLQIKKARDGIRSRPNNKKAIKFKERRRAFFVCSTVVVNHLALANPTDSFVFYTTLAQSLQRLFLCFIPLWPSHSKNSFCVLYHPGPVTPSGFKHPGQSDRLSQGK